MRQQLNQLLNVLTEISRAYPQHAHNIGPLLGIIHQIPAELDRLAKAADEQRQNVLALTNKLEQANVVGRNLQAVIDLRDKEIVKLKDLVIEYDETITTLRQQRLAEHQVEIRELQAEIKRLSEAYLGEIEKGKNMKQQLRKGFWNLMGEGTP